jgi:hypothetical protein
MAADIALTGWDKRMDFSVSTRDEIQCYQHATDIALGAVRTAIKSLLVSELAKR